MSIVTEVFNEEGFREVYDMYYRPMVLYAVRFVRVEEVAEDIVQEVFIRLWLRRQDIDGDDGLARILHISVRNGCLDYLKHLSVERAYTSGAALETEDDLENAIFAAEIYARLFSEIDQLPSRQRDTMRLVCDGHTNAEIAETMAVSMDTVKNQKYKALAALRKAFRRER